MTVIFRQVLLDPPNADTGVDRLAELFHSDFLGTCQYMQTKERNPRLDSSSLASAQGAKWEANELISRGPFLGCNNHPLL